MRLQITCPTSTDKWLDADNPTNLLATKQEATQVFGANCKRLIRDAAVESYDMVIVCCDAGGKWQDV